MRIENLPGGYAYVPGLRFAGNGVAALPGMSIERGVLREAVPLEDGFAAARRHLDAVGRPVEALCGIELRLPARLDLDGFVAFNDIYLAKLRNWGLTRDGTSPLARTNVSPTLEPPREPTVLAFSYTVPHDTGDIAFVLSGVAELPVATAYPEGIVRRGETTEEALLEKARCAATVAAHHLKDLGVRWDADASVHLYTAHPIAHAFSRTVLPRAGVAPAHGIVWHDATPPVSDLELEIDIRRYRREIAVEG